MDITLQGVLNVLGVVGYIVIGGLVIFIKNSKKAQALVDQGKDVLSDILSKAVIYIKEAEEFYQDTTNAGGQKFDYVVNKLYNLVPDIIKPIITKDMIEKIVQSTFDEIEEYAKIQIENKIDKVNENENCEN